MNKKKRQALIKQLIAKHDIETQDELIDLLKEAGAETTQATISRDIREMHIIKVRDTDGRVKYAIFSPPEEATEDRLREVFHDAVVNITQVQFMNILNTLLGNADVVAAELDELNYPEIVATLAGTDTIVLISKDVEDARIIHDKLQEYII
ncbi:arginine repressor [Vagococcus acidifermentans]|uniref:Arginine repressor n=1 Tax=Vagococcus acidifermentans TaxID=564710 RepID=A0A430AUT6_9ENTE|nr:arginine repressor [Vagococcus acidifermentans]RSU11824.1 arginine repressor [Vagococcus acidifermentans]